MAGTAIMVVRPGVRDVCELFDAKSEEALDGFCRVAVAPIKQDVLGMAELLGVRGSVIEQIGAKTVQLLLPTEDAETSDRLVAKNIYISHSEGEHGTPELGVSIQPSLSLLRQVQRVMHVAYFDNYGLQRDSDYDYCRQQVVALTGRMGLAQYLFDTLQRNVHAEHPVVRAKDASFARSSFAGFIALELFRQIPDDTFKPEARTLIANAIPAWMRYQVHQIGVVSHPNRALELNDMPAKGLVRPMTKKEAEIFINLFNANSIIRNRLSIVQ
jgi:hypothetical protein